MNKIPSILSFQRGIILSDAVMYNVIDGNAASQVSVVRHGLLGTQNVAGKGGDNKPIKNPQRTESAKTDVRASGMEVRFSMSTARLDDLLFACNDNNFRASIESFIDRFRASEELREVCRRYSRNLLNARWLWRNRMLGKSIAVTVTDLGGRETITVDALSIPLGFDRDYSEQEQKLAEWLTFSLTTDPRRFDVSARIDFGMTGSIEVFPSQNFIAEKPDGFARSLYKVNRMSRQELLRIMRNDNPDTFAADILDMGIAAIRDQKIGNAIRTIDTWYDGADDKTPIPVEPLGANLERNMKMRKSRNDLFTYLCSLDNLQSSIVGFNHEAAFVLACMIRGFLAGEGDENSASKGGKKAKEAVADEQVA